MQGSLNQLLRKLDFISDEGLEKNGLYFYEQPETWKNKFSVKVEEVLKKIKPSAFFINSSEYYFSENSFVLFFEVESRDNQVIRKIHKDCWNFGKTPVVFIILPDELQILNGFSFDSKKGLLDELANQNKQDEFNFWELISGKTWNNYNKNINNTKNKVDNTLLKNIFDARELLKKINVGGESYIKSELANSLIGRLIFTRYLIDREVEIIFNNTKFDIVAFENMLESRNVENLYDWFRFIDNKFFDDAKERFFPVQNLQLSDELINSECVGVLYDLFKGNEVKTGQIKLDFKEFKYYDFQIIPVEFISNIYEFFMGESQSENKAFYTPLFLAEYIVKQTVTKYFEENRNEFNCRVIDPSCGSGIFLVETLRQIITRFQAINNPNGAELKKHLNSLVIDNIFGVDKDPAAVNIAIFSIYITLLDFQDPRDIAHFKFPNLRDNFFEGDFFDDEFITSWYLFKKKVTETNFDFVLGNPPWGDVSKYQKKYLKYCKNRAKNEGIRDKLISNDEIAQAFLLRLSDLFRQNSKEIKAAFIVTSKILYNLQADKFRTYFLEKFEIEQVLELSSVRDKVFRKDGPNISELKKTTTGPACIIFYKYTGKPANQDAIVKHISLKPNKFFDLFRAFVIEKYDYKEVMQGYFKEYDWLWKVLVYGNLLDFHFIKRLKNIRYKSIQEIISDNELNSGQGIQINGSKRSIDEYFMNLKFLDTSREKQMLRRFYIDFTSVKLWDEPLLYRSKKKNRDLFEPPYILFKSGLTSDFKTVAAYSEEKMVFTDSVTSIKGNIKQQNLLKNLLGIFNSNLYAYNSLTVGSSIGIFIEQLQNKEIFNFPAIIDDRIANYVDRIQDYYKNQTFIEHEVCPLEKELDILLYQLYRLNSTEKSLLDYAFKVSIPLWKGEQEPYRNLRSSQDKIFIEKYVNVFVKHFSAIYEPEDGNYFNAEIYYSQDVIAVNFVISQSEPNEVIEWKPQIENQEIILRRFIGLGFEEQASNLYIQKDIKGFNDSSFYVIKPNEYKVWHEAIAYLDLNEFIENIFKQTEEFELVEV
jgi:N-6 DNA Methylase